MNIFLWYWEDRDSRRYIRYWSAWLMCPLFYVWIPLRILKFISALFLFWRLTLSWACVINMLIFASVFRLISTDSFKNCSYITLKFISSKSHNSLFLISSKIPSFPCAYFWTKMFLLKLWVPYLVIKLCLTYFLNVRS